MILPKYPRIDRIHQLLGLAAAFVLMALAVVLADASSQAKPIQIGMAKTFFHDRSKGVVEIVAGDFKDVMKKTTGLNGELTSQYAPAEVADKVNGKQLDFGIFHAHDFAWVQKKYPDLLPLMIAVNRRHIERAYFVVHKNSPAKSIADLRGKILDLPLGSPQHCRMFVEKACASKDGKGSTAFFGSIQKSKSQSEGLNEVAREKAQVTVVDTSELEAYKEIRGPVFTNNLRVLQQSEVFPPAVIVYKKGAIDPATLAQFRDGLLKAHTIAAGRDMMKEWNIDAFELIPKDYSRSVEEISKAYPPALSP